MSLTQTRFSQLHLGNSCLSMESPIRTPIKCSSITNSAMNKNSNYEASACFNSTDGVKVKVAVMFIEKIPQINTMYRMLYFFNC